MACRSEDNNNKHDSSSSSLPERNDIIVKHWFYEQILNGKKRWTPFSFCDSQNLEDAFESHDPNRKTVTTDGGRYDVDIPNRTRIPVYWTEEAKEVRRCSWFFKQDSRFVPYDEGIAELLEVEYQDALSSNDWHRRVELPNGEHVIFHDAAVIVHFQQKPGAENWGAPTSPISKPRVVKRGIDDFHIEDGDCDKVDHVLFMVHGIGSVCDLKFRTVEEVVDEFRSIAQQLIQAHYRTTYDEGQVGRVEVLPVSWWSSLHSEENGIDEKLKSITLESIPKLRSFTNETLVDVLFYTSPIFSQHIIDTVANALNKKYSMFLLRNKGFKGKVSLAGHSLGSLILFDLLSHQTPSKANEKPGTSEYTLTSPSQPLHRPLKRMESKQIDYRVGLSGTGQPLMNYPQLNFPVQNFFALGSPIGMFVTIRGIDKLGCEFRLPTCEGFFNIFHPYDPVAYRLEALVNLELANFPPVLIPHHKGRKRMHLELKDTMTRVSTDIKSKVISSFKNVTDTVFALNPLHRQDKSIEDQVHDVLESQLSSEMHETPPSSPEKVFSDDPEISLGRLNNLKRIDYVLQEAPLEFFNEYLFALASHVGYWDSPDTILFIVKQIYSSMGIEADKEVPHHILKMERPNSMNGGPSTSSSPGALEKR